MAEPLAVSGNPIPATPEPAGEFSFKQMIPTLVFDVAMPIVAYNVLVNYGVSTLWALVAGGLFPAINNLRVWVKSRRLEPPALIGHLFPVDLLDGTGDLGDLVGCHGHFRNPQGGLLQRAPLPCGCSR